jgi:DNA primase
VIPQTFIADLLSRADVVEVVGRYVQLKKGGANFMGLCPFHNEKSPSFTVSQSKQFFHCFGCGVHGSAISFLMEHLGLSYPEAIKQLASEVGMTVPESEQRGPTEQQKQAPGILQTLETVEQFYRNRLKDDKRAVDYLKSRGLSGQTAKRFGLGYAPEGWRGLEAAVSNYAAEEMVTSGLVIESEDTDSEGEKNAGKKNAGKKKRYDRFRDRIMFPIRNPKGQVIGFGGRVLDRGEPKYLNSPETPVFSKGRELYGLFEGRDAIRTQNYALVVEGYMDVVMLAQHEVQNAVATLGTATTPVHIQKLTRIVDRIVFSFDGDKAGRRAARRALETSLPLVADDKRFDFLFLPDDHDPDSFVRDFGRQAFENYVLQAVPLSEFMVQTLSADLDMNSPEGRAMFQAEARPLLQLMPQATAIRGQMLRRVASMAQVDVVDIERYLAAKPLSPALLQAAQASSFGPELNGGESRGPRASKRPAKSNQSRWAGNAVDDRPAPEKWPNARRPKPLAIEERVRVIAALFPKLCRDFDANTPEEARLLPPELEAWIEQMAHLAPTTHFAAVCEMLGESDPRAAEQLSQDARREFADLTEDEASKEFFGALHFLRRKAVARQMTQLVEQGLETSQEKEAYQSLARLERELRASGS